MLDVTRLDESGTATTLVNKIKGAGVGTVSNISLIGDDEQAGTFIGGLHAGLSFESGVLFATGRASDAEPDSAEPGGNSTGGVLSENLTSSGDSELGTLLGATTDNASGLQFEFQATSTGRLRLDFSFASEEYFEWDGVGDNLFEDGVGVFVERISSPTQDLENNAWVPTTPLEKPVSLDEINGAAKTYLLNDNDYFDSGDVRPGFHIEYDAHTTRMIAQTTINVVNGEDYEIKIVTGDASDDVFDSGIFLEEGSLRVESAPSEPSTGGAIADLRKWSRFQTPSDGSSITVGSTQTVSKASSTEIKEIVDVDGTFNHNTNHKLVALHTVVAKPSSGSASYNLSTGFLYSGTLQIGEGNDDGEFNFTGGKLAANRVLVGSDGTFNGDLNWSHDGAIDVDGGTLDFGPASGTGKSLTIEKSGRFSLASGTVTVGTLITEVGSYGQVLGMTSTDDATATLDAFRMSVRGRFHQLAEETASGDPSSGGDLDVTTLSVATGSASVGAQFLQAGGSGDYNTLSIGFDFINNANNGDTSTYELSSGSLTVNNNLYVGPDTIQPHLFNHVGGDVNVSSGTVWVGASAGNGTYEISGGSLIANKIIVGDFSTGLFKITGSSAGIVAHRELRFASGSSYETTVSPTIVFTKPNAEVEIASTADTAHSGTNDTTLHFTGDNSSSGFSTLEVASEDFGNTASGLTDNFAWDEILIGTGSTKTVLKLLNSFDNAPGADVLYVREIDFANEFSEFDLNGFTVYAELIDLEGTFKNGSVTQINPEPSTLALWVFLMFASTRWQGRCVR